MTILWWGLGRGPNLSHPVFFSSLLGSAQPSRPRAVPPRAGLGSREQPFLQRNSLNWSGRPQPKPQRSLDYGITVLHLRTASDELHLWIMADRAGWRAGMFPAVVRGGGFVPSRPMPRAAARPIRPPCVATASTTGDDHEALLCTGRLQPGRPHRAACGRPLQFEHEKVDLKAKRTAGGADFTAINPKGYVPALTLDGRRDADRERRDLGLDRAPEPGKLAPSGPMGHTHLLHGAGLHLDRDPQELQAAASAGGSESEKAKPRPRLIVKRMGYLAETMQGDYLFGAQRRRGRYATCSSCCSGRRRSTSSRPDRWLRCANA